MGDASAARRLGEDVPRFAQKHSYRDRHVYLRWDGNTIKARCRCTFEPQEAIAEGADAAVVMRIVDSAEGAFYDLAKCVDRGVLNRLATQYPSLRLDDDYISMGWQDDFKFRRTWELIP